MKRHNLLIVDDEKEILRSMQMTFMEDHEVFTASTGAEALAILQQHDIALVITDQRMPKMTGVQLLQKVLLINPNIIRILLTGYTDTAALIEAINQGHIYQYITKPWERYELQLTVRRALEAYEMTLENQRLIKELSVINQQLTVENTFLKKEVTKNLSCSEIVGHSAVMQKIFEQVNRVVNSTVTVLLTGETGTGKTLLAYHIHSSGSRKDCLFIEQNCATLPETLLESELFGHKRGAFTGAISDHKGLFEVADGGTLFLDEITEMSPALQVKLLQVLQNGQFRRVGDTHYRQVDIRIIAATNKDLSVEIEQGRFRKDLYYRLCIFPIHLPPLRQRIEDIPLLAMNYLKKVRHKFTNPVNGFSEEALESLCDYDYPGNIRELENLIERALILSTGDLIEPGEWLPTMPIEDRSHLSRLEKIEQAEIQRLLEVHGRNLVQVAKELGISRTTLWRRIKEYQLPA